MLQEIDKKPLLNILQLKQSNKMVITVYNTNKRLIVSARKAMSLDTSNPLFKEGSTCLL